MATPEFPDFHEATIAAIATPPGAGGIGIIRISGPLSAFILREIFRPRNPSPSFLSHRLYFGAIVNPRTGAMLDEVLAVYMRAPLTYTREEVVEIHAHGSYLILQEILALILTFPSTRLAEPGEFTKRAFLNGRIDLTQAEAVAELLSARTREGAGLALTQLCGALQDEIGKIRDALLAIRAIMEVAIDFPDEDVEIIEPDALAVRLAREVEEPLVRLVARAGGGRIIREGVPAVILGRPNVGKSSLLNCLLREDRAIVTEIPGTTRDTIEEYLDIKGVPVRIIDTAGIRDTIEEVEEIGILRARQKLAEAELVLLVLDGREGARPEDQALFAVAATKKVLVVVNKSDLVPEFVPGIYEQAFPGVPVVAVSALTGQGILRLEEALYQAVTGGLPLEEPGTPVPNARQSAALARTLAAVRQVGEGLGHSLPLDLLAIDLQAALAALGEITGETTTEDVLDMIFTEFCLGK